MLQIVTKMYFRPGVPLHSTVQRDVLYTNRWLVDREPVTLPVGELTPSTTTGGSVLSVQVSIVEHLEAEQPDGTPEVRIATSGTELIDDLADLLSFAPNSVFSRNRDLVDRLVSAEGQRRREAPAGLFRDTFDPARPLREDELNDLRSFMSQLLALKRSSFDAAIRAIRRIVRATEHGADDPTVAYTDFVAALESLSGADKHVPAPSWEQLEDDKRKPIDAALKDVDEATAGRVRNAVIEGERLKLMNRFVHFTLDHVSESFFRSEAVEAIRPIRGPDLEPALKEAYRVRSRSVHSLFDLPPEAWALGDRADTVELDDRILLSLEGLARLARHVVRAYVARAPVGVDADFDWRASLPGQVKMALAPQYWVHVPRGFSHTSADSYFRGFVDHVLNVLAGREKSLSDMRAVLEQVETQAPGLADGPAKTEMVALYVIWHRLLPADAHRPDSATFIARHRHLLDDPSLTAFVAGLLTNSLPDWSTEEWTQLATERSVERKGKKTHLLPATLDSALQAHAAERLIEDGQQAEAMVFVKRAVEELPGHSALIAWEKGLRDGEPVTLNLRTLVLGLAPDSENEGD